jgi:hypothetical protein
MKSVLTSAAPRNNVLLICIHWYSLHAPVALSVRSANLADLCNSSLWIASHWIFTQFYTHLKGVSSDKPPQSPAGSVRTSSALGRISSSERLDPARRMMGPVFCRKCTHYNSPLYIIKMNNEIWDLQGFQIEIFYFFCHVTFIKIDISLNIAFLPFSLSAGGWSMPLWRSISAGRG